MRYIGGKIRQGKAISEHIRKIWNGEQYIEPFMGACGSSVAVGIPNCELSDIQQSIVTMWTALIYGEWIPPEEVTPEMYYKIKEIIDPLNPLTAYIGYGLSFGGKFFGGYARNIKGDDTSNISKGTFNSVMKKTKILKALQPKISRKSYLDYSNYSGCIFYLDPPYAGTHQTKFDEKFDNIQFWDFATNLAKRNKVIVSNFSAPDNWKSIYSWGDTVIRHHSGIEDKKGKTNEQLFMLE